MAKEGNFMIFNFRGISSYFIPSPPEVKVYLLLTELCYVQILLNVSVVFFLVHKIKTKFYYILKYCI